MEKWKSVADKELPRSETDTIGVMPKGLYPNTWRSISILASLSAVLNPSAEHYFSTSIRLKTYMRNNHSGDRLTGLALLSVRRSILVNNEEITHTISRMPRKDDFVL